jgi:hypothetical protein
MPLPGVTGSSRTLSPLLLDRLPLPLPALFPVPLHVFMHTLYQEFQKDLTADSLREVLHTTHSDLRRLFKVHA